MTPRAFGLAQLLLPVLVLWGLYAGSLGYELVWTDASAIGDGTLLRPPGAVLAAFGEPLHRMSGRGAAVIQPYYRPLQVVLLSEVDAYAGRDPGAFRSAGLVVASLCLVAFGLLARRLLGRADLALFAALWVAVHPVGIESTVWIAGISGPLCALFVILAVALGLRAADAGTRAAAAGWTLLSLVSLLAALLSKERALVTPALLAAGLVARAFGSGPRPAQARGGTARAFGLVLAQAALVAVFMGVVRPAVLGRGLPPLPPIGGSMLTQWATALASWPASLAWLFAPLESTTNDAVRIVTSMASPLALLGMALALGSAGIAVALLRRGHPVAALGLAWLWIAFLPTSGLLPMLHARGERYLYLSSFGAALLLADLAPAALDRVPSGLRAIAGYGLAGLALLVPAVTTASRLPDWESSLTLFRVELERDPEYSEGRFQLASELASRGRHLEAQETMAPLLAPPERPPEYARQLNRLALTELACANQVTLGRYEAAIEGVLRQGPVLASVPTLRICLGEARQRLGRNTEALADYHAVAQGLGPATPGRVLLEIARLEAEAGRGAAAREWLERASRAAPADPALQAEISRLRAAATPRRRGRPRAR